MKPAGRSASTSCAACAEANRESARFCRGCGKSMGGRDAFAAFIGAQDHVAKLRHRLQVAASQRDRGATPDLHTLLMGRGATGKSTLVECFALAARELELVDSATVVCETAHGVERVPDLVALLEGYRGRVVKISDAQALMLRPDEERRATHVLSRLYAAFEAPAMQRAGAPIVFLSGSPGPLSAQLAVDERLRKTFGIQLPLPDLSPDILLALAQRTLAESWAGLDPEAVERARNRCAHLVGQADFLNAKSIVDDVLNRWLPAAMERSPDARPVLIIADDIPDPVWVRRTPQELLAELDDMVGMDAVRTWLEGLLKAEISKQDRAARRGTPYAYRGHVVMEGNPGTGKTTVVRQFARLFHAAGILPTERIVECSPSTLKGQYLGDSGKKTSDAIDAAIGGILFLDEAHGLAGDPGLSRGADTYLQEIAKVLVPRLENDGSHFVAVFAGYPGKVEDALRSLDEGLPGRISQRVPLKDYTGPQLAEIFARLAAKADMVLADETRPRLEAVCNLMCLRGGDGFANARSARTLFEQAERAMLTRAGNDGRTLLPADIPDDTSGAQLESREVVYANAMAELDALVGLLKVKQTIQNLAASAPIERRRRECGIGGKLSPRHWLFLGNPGVGKTEVAKLMARLLYGADALLTPNLVEVVGKALQSGSRGPAQEVEAAVRRAQGGVLFIDEAYGLTSADALDVLLTRLENDGGRFVAIAAGYPAEMAAWLTLNEGLERRFSRSILFDDYSREDIAEIVERRARAGRFALAPGVRDALLALYATPEVTAALPRRNGGMARVTLDLMIEHSNVRLGRLPAAERATADLNLLVAEDVPKAHELVGP